MTSLTTIAATALIAVGGTAAAFTGLHPGQSAADAAAAARTAQSETAYTVTMSAEDLAHLAALMNGKQAQPAATGAVGDKSRTHQKQRATHRQRTTHRDGARGDGISSSAGGSSTTQHSTAHSGGDDHGGGSAQHSGAATDHGGEAAHDGGDADHGSGGCD